MIEDSNGEYKESTTDTFPGYEYFYNQEKSSCMDMSGNPVEDSLLYDQDNKKVTVTIGDTSSCYLYFDNWKSGDSSNFAQYLINKNEMWQSGLEGDGYRYIGTNPNNFVCFGTTDKTECTTNEDKYMYRVIGVFTDSDSNTNVKLIKYSYLSDHLAYTSVKSKIITNAEDFSGLIKDEIFDNINGSYFLTNANYNYFSNNLWISKIQTNLNQTCNTYTQTNGFTVYNLYDNYSSEEIYNYERFHCTKPGYTVTLMNLSDFILADGSDALNYKTTNNTVINNDSWISSWNEPEWTNAKMGARLVNQVNSVYAPAAYSVGGNKLYINSNYAIAVRPVFSLITAIEFSDGTGTSDNPYILGINLETSINPPKININLSNQSMYVSITKGTGNLNKYCINNKASINDCEWKKIYSTSISYEIPKDGKYYVHVIDDAGYIAEDSITYTFANYLKDSGELWQSGLEGDGYRFTGTGAYTASTTPSNFICFGTTDKSTCTSNPDTYMYRIIGVFNNQLKLIKLTSLTSNYIYAGTAFAQNSESYRLYTNSYLASVLNSTAFLTNTTYSYMQNAKWTNLIDEYSKTSVNTATYSESGPNYYNSLTPKQIYLHEYNKSGKSSTKGYWSTYTDKITVMDASDYVLSLGATSLNMTSGTYSNRSTLKTSWLFLGNNKYGNTSGNYTTEHTTAFYGVGSSTNYVYSWTINPNGYLYNTSMSNEYAVRPVFYLTSDVKSSSGTGTLTDPYILDIS